MARQEGDRVYYAVCDQAGTPREFWSDYGRLHWAGAPRAWGELRKSYYLRPLHEPDGKEFCPLRFQGQWCDPESGLHHNRFRYYDPIAAQYASPDPIGLAGGIRPQGYVHKPTAWIDPLGLMGKGVRGGEEGLANPVPKELARVIAGSGPFPTLGPPGRLDVFVTAADDIAGLSPAQISQRLTIPASDTFTIIRFPTPSTGIASPVFRTDLGFVGGGRTLGGAREFVIPNGPIPPGASVRPSFAHEVAAK